MAKQQRKNPKETPMQAVLAAMPKTIPSGGETAHHKTFRKVYDRILTRSGLAAVFRKQGHLYAADDRWLTQAYEAAHKLVFGRPMTVSEKYALHGDKA